MKRRELVRHLGQHGCELLREGGRHSVYVNRANNKVSTVPRHNEIKDFLAVKICRDLDIPPPAQHLGVQLRAGRRVVGRSYTQRPCGQIVSCNA